MAFSGVLGDVKGESHEEVSPELGLPAVGGQSVLPRLYYLAGSAALGHPTPYDSLDTRVWP